MLLRNLLGAFLDSLPTERALDVPFLALLQDSGFYDIHFTHGPAEFGKDFIGKRVDGDRPVQYSFQSKHGAISQSEWRRDVQPQLLEAALSPLSHPSFDSSLEHQVVLVLTGRLSGNAALASQSFSDQLERTYGKRSLRVWDRETLVELFLQHGPDSVPIADATQLEALGSFLLAYGASMKGRMLTPDIELHSRRWLDSDELFRSCLEAEQLAAVLQKDGHHYEAAVCLIAGLRTTMAAMHCGGRGATAPR